MKVTFRFPESEVTVEGFEQLNLLAHAQLAERGLQSRCGGQCECCTCRVRLIAGRLSEMREPERVLLQKAGETGPDVRLSCQAFPVFGSGGVDVVVEVPRTRFKDARIKP